ncbi:MAG: MarR family winged helix-turn-helix transcriptional regulator [Eubacteriales bacterium]
MEINELRNSFTDSLRELYDMEVIASLMEFCQGEIRVLLYLYSNSEQDIYPSELSDALFVSRQRITAILSSLRNKKYISMEIAKDDRRKMKVMLTECGMLYITEKQESAVKYIDSLILSLGEKNITEFTRLLNLTIEKIKNHN